MFTAIFYWDYPPLHQSSAELVLCGHKQPVKDNDDAVSDKLSIFIPNQKVIYGTLNSNEPAMYPKILKVRSPGIASRIYGT